MLKSEKNQKKTMDEILKNFTSRSSVGEKNIKKLFMKFFII